MTFCNVESQEDLKYNFNDEAKLHEFYVIKIGKLTSYQDNLHFMAVHYYGNGVLE